MWLVIAILQGSVGISSFSVIALVSQQVEIPAEDTSMHNLNRIPKNVERQELYSYNG